MELSDIAVITAVARTGMAVKDVLAECVDKQVSAIPFCDASGAVTGRITIDRIFRLAGLPSDLVKGAHLLGDAIDHLNITLTSLQQLLEQPVETLVDENPPALTPHSPVIKALAIMESFDTTCLFLMDQGHYQGSITRLELARQMLQGQI